MMSQGSKRSSKWRTNSPAYLLLQLTNNFKWQLRAPAQIWQQYSMHGRMVDLYWKKLHGTFQGSNFLWGSFSNRYNVRAPIRFRRKSQPQHFKRWFFLKNGPIHFHISSTSVFRLVKWNQLTFSSIEINKPLPAPVHSKSDSRNQF